MASYALVFEGDILAGFDRDDVMARFGEAFRLSAEDVERVFGHPRVVLKRNLDRAKADAYAERLARLGMAISLDAIPADPAASAGDGGAVAAAVPRAVVQTPVSASRDPAEAPAEPAAAPAARELSGAASEVDQLRETGFEFHGTGSEFFRIWIVNLLLTIITFGVYSAWAKVRTQRYFYGNTRLDGASFEYLASPMSILRGRIVAFGLLFIYMLADQFVPLLAVVLGLLFFAIFPWVMVRGLAFRNHNSAWRGVRFGFDGRLGQAYEVFLLWPMLGVLSLGLLFPYAVCKQQHFIVGNSRYGVEPFRFDARPGAFYRIALVVVGLGVAAFLLSLLIGATLPLLSPLALIAGYLAIFAVSNVMFTNLRYNSTTIGAHATFATYQPGSYAMLVLTNMIGIVLTLGLFYPWAKVRSARYAAENIGVVVDGDLDGFVAAQREQVSAIGGEIGDMFDADLGI